jgi:c-di-GMP-related signal transduction protein
MIDVMLDTPVDEVLKKIPLDYPTKDVLLGQPSPLRPVFQLILAHESGEWEAARSLAEGASLDPDTAGGYYWQAQQWAREVTSGA